MKEDIKKNNINIILIPSSTYKQQELDIVEHTANTYTHICYVNTCHPFDQLLKHLKEKKIPLKKFLFIDNITKQPKKEHDHCIYLNTPKALTTLSLTIKKTLNAQQFDSFLFDSISTLTTYHTPQTLTKFVHDLFTTLKKKKLTALFTIQNNTDKNLITDISMFADNVITLGGKKT
jgi:archaellum biogenesis ATPase FlaH